MQKNYNDICSFCLNELKIDSLKLILDCGHIYHNTCWDKYNAKLCPLCKQKKITKQSYINMYDYDAFVWIFGSFIPYTHSLFIKKYNMVQFTNETVNFISGFFWRLFDGEILEKLESNYQEYIKDNLKNEFTINIDTTNYNIIYDDKNAHFSNENIENKICIQKSPNNNYKPILRMKWKDVINNLLIIGFCNNVFFDNIYVYRDDDNNIYLFDMINQEKINNLYKRNKNFGKIKIGNQKFELDIVENDIIDIENEVIYDVDIIDKKNICYC